LTAWPVKVLRVVGGGWNMSKFELGEVGYFNIDFYRGSMELSVLRLDASRRTIAASIFDPTTR
jgi:hypothetical protein